MKLAVVAVAGTVTDAGNVSTLGIAPAMATEVPAVGAALVNVTVQLVLVLEDSGAGAALHCKAEISGGIAREMEALLEEPLREAVTVAV